MADTLPAGLPSGAAEAARDTLGGAVAAATQLPDPLSAALLASAREAFVQGLQLTAVIGTAVLAGIAVLVLVVLRRTPAPAEPAGQPGTAAGPTFEVAGAD